MRKEINILTGEVTEHEDAPGTTLSTAEIKKQKKAEIAALEQSTIMNRAVREFMLLSAEAQAQAQGITPAQLYALNPAYKSVKDVDTQIAALRAQL
jgi:hypothetical protein